MARIRFCDGLRNLYIAPTTTLTASSEALALPVGATQNPDRSYVWRSLTATTTQTIQVDLGVAALVNSFVVANVRRLGVGELKLYHRGSAGTPGSRVWVATMATQDRDTRATYAFFSSLTERHWELEWTNPAAESAYAELGYAHLGTYLEPSVNVSVPARISRPDPSIPSVSVTGQESYAVRQKYFTGAWDFRLIPESMLTDLRTMWDSMGVSGAFFQVLDTALPWTTWYARWAGPMDIEVEPNSPARYSVSIPWREIR